MKKTFTFLALGFMCLSGMQAQSVVSIGSSTVVVDTILTGLNVPWEIIYGPDGYIWMTERKGLVSRVDPVAKTRTTMLDLTGTIFYQDEAGMLGMALHPDFATSTKEVFLVYTYGPNSNKRERLVKYTFNGTALVNPQIVLDSIRANTFHDGSRLMFMPDKTLLMTTGEAGDTALSQNLNSLNGKILRINTDGTVPADNPFPGSYVYTYGHRNPQGLTRGPNGEFYISEHGPSTDDEFQVLEKGRNYGWPNVRGFCDLPAETSFCTTNNVKEPLINWSPTIATNDLVYYSNNSIPELDGRFLMVTLKAKKLVAVQLNAAGTSYVSQASYLANMFGRLRDICVGPQQEIYLATNGADAANIDPDTHSLLVLRPAQPVVGIAERSNDPGISVFPTLVKEELTIVSKQTISSPVLLKVTDLCGKLHQQQQFSGSAYHCDLSTLQDGMYFVELSTADKQLGQYKIIVSK